MKIANVTTALSKFAGRSGLVLKKYSPEILLVAGIVGAVGSTVLACRATLKVEGVLLKHRQNLDKINDTWTMVENKTIPFAEYTDKDHKKDTALVYVQTGLEFVKLYGPALSLGALSIASLVGGHGIMKSRNVALVAAYKAVEESFSAYRKRVVEELGEDKDYIYRHGLKVDQVTENVVDESGKSKKVKKEVLSKGDTNGYSMYAVFYDDGCKQWTKNPEYNLMYLKSQQNYFNDILKTRGHVFLNEVYDALGVPRTKAGSVVGWVIGDGDNFIDFGIFDPDKKKSREFVNGYERVILLDFNVDGVIYDLIEQ